MQARAKVYLIVLLVFLNLVLLGVWYLNKEINLINTYILPSPEVELDEEAEILRLAEQVLSAHQEVVYFRCLDNPSLAICQPENQITTIDQVRTLPEGFSSNTLGLYLEELETQVKQSSEKNGRQIIRDSLDKTNSAVLVYLDGIIAELEELRCSQPTECVRNQPERLWYRSVDVPNSACDFKCLIDMAERIDDTIIQYKFPEDENIKKALREAVIAHNYQFQIDYAQNRFDTYCESQYTGCTSSELARFAKLLSENMDKFKNIYEIDRFALDQQVEKILPGGELWQIDLNAS